MTTTLLTDADKATLSYLTDAQIAALEVAMAREAAEQAEVEALVARLDETTARTDETLARLV